MRIDAHQHFWHYVEDEFAWLTDDMAALRRDFLPGSLEPGLREAGYDGCVSVQAAQTLAETDFWLDQARLHPFVLGVVGWFDLAKPDLPDVLARYANEPRLVGARHIVQAEAAGFLERPDYVRGLRTLAQFGLTYDLLVREWQLPEALRFLAQVPEVKVVLDHCAKPAIKSGEWEPWASHMRQAARCPGVCCKLSGLSFEADWHTWSDGTIRPYVQHVLECFGPDRCMVGSDWPVCLAAGTYTKTMEAIESCLTGLSAGERADVVGGTAARFYGIGVPGDSASM